LSQYPSLSQPWSTPFSPTWANILPPQYHEALEAPEKLHVTLHVFNANSEEAIRQQSSIPGAGLVLVGVEDPQRGLSSCRDELRRRLGNIPGIVFTDELRNIQRASVPHVTVVKSEVAFDWVPSQEQHTLWDPNLFTH